MSGEAVMKGRGMGSLSEITVGEMCDFCGERVQVSQAMIRPDDTFACPKCHNANHLSVEQRTAILGRIGDRIEMLRKQGWIKD
jgi:hypothetical protein